MSVEYETDYEVGQDNVQILGMDMHNPVFFISAVLILAFVIGTLIFPAEAKTALDGAKGWTIDNFDWLFMFAANVFVLFCIALIFLPVGKIRLGGNDARPDFSTFSWFAMLFAAGMGIGLMFWSVAEPVGYYTNWFGTPLNVAPNTPEAKDMALGAVMYHWGLHPWAIYGVVALSLAFFAYNKGMPLTIRSAFYPILGERCWGWAGHIIDILAVLATIFGLATSLGLGAKQAAGGMHFLFDTPNAINVQIAIIIGVTAAAVISVMRGLDGGVKLLSNINMGLAALLLLFVMIAGPTLLIFTSMGQTAVDYVANIIPLSNWIGREDQGFLHDWTVFYWAWWISWSPFVGMFIARVSRGRTVREFLTAVLLVPTLVTVVWMATFG
ncbi:MAG TPA: BCCT family transporter, partial [Alcanivorax sp.]|nr:BCCT family transporter [Alcanivorax sp.]